MSLLLVVQDVCAAVGVLSPTSVFTNLSANRTMQEMVSLANETAQAIAYDEVEWNKLKAVTLFQGDGYSTAFDLPLDYKRMLLTANVWRSTSAMTPMQFVPDTDEWLNRRARNIYHSYGEWTMLGGQMLIAPVMGVGVSAYFTYLHKNCVTLAAGGAGDNFVADGDSFLLDERVFKLGMIWRWKSQKGSPYAEDMANYGVALEAVAARDLPSPIIVGRRVSSAVASVAYPFMVPTP